MTHYVVMKRIALALVAASLCGSSFAQFARSEGTFRSNQLVLQVVLLDPEKGVAAASASLSEGACSGTVAGIGNITSKKLTFAPYIKMAGGESCSVTVEWDAKWHKAKVTDNGSCAPYHGSGCSWASQSVTKR